MDGKDLGWEGAGFVSLGQPGSLTCKVDEGDDMIDCCVLHGKVRIGNKVIKVIRSGEGPTMPTLSEDGG